MNDMKSDHLIKEAARKEKATQGINSKPLYLLELSDIADKFRNRF